jgi:hypothetical protein
MMHIKEILKEIIFSVLILFFSLLGVSFCLLIVYKSVTNSYETIKWVVDGGLFTLKYGDNTFFAIFSFLCVLFGLTLLLLAFYFFGKMCLTFGYAYLQKGYFTILKSFKKIKSLI